jgi:hypothetical protein
VNATAAALSVDAMRAGLFKGAEAIRWTGNGAAVTFLLAERDLMESPVFRQFLIARSDGSLDVSFMALAAWADEQFTMPKGDRDRGAVARICCLIAGYVPFHDPGSAEAERWTLPAAFDDLTDWNATCSTTGAALQAITELALSRRWEK